MLKAVPLFQLKYWPQSTIHSLYFKRFHWYLLEGRRPGPRWERSWMCWCQFSFPIGKTREGLGKFALRIDWGFLCHGVDRDCYWGQMTNRWVSAATSQHSPQFCTCFLTCCAGHDILVWSASGGVLLSLHPMNMGWNKGNAAWYLYLHKHCLVSTNPQPLTSAPASSTPVCVQKTCGRRWWVSHSSF